MLFNLKTNVNYLSVVYLLKSILQGNQDGQVVLVQQVGILNVSDFKRFPEKHF